MDQHPAAPPQFRGAPALKAFVTPSAGPVLLSRMSNDFRRPDEFLTPPVEDAFVFQIPLILSGLADVRYGSRQIAPEGLCRPGYSYLLDMSAAPSRRLDTIFDNATVYFHRTTLEELAYEKGRPALGGIRQPAFGVPDPIMFHLAQAWVPILDNPALATSLFVDTLALSLHEHVLSTYGGVRSPGRRRSAVLLPWQMRKIKDLVDGNIKNPSISDLAAECNISASYFAEAFKQTTGLSPHQWLLKCRVERAKAMLRDTDSSLASIALECGFFDQSHFSRVFVRFQNCGPGAWRRYHRTG